MSERERFNLLKSSKVVQKLAKLDENNLQNSAKLRKIYRIEPILEIFRIRIQPLESEK